MADMNGVITSSESDGGGLLGDIIDLEWTDGDFCLFFSSVVDGNTDTKLDECLQVVLSNLTGDGRDRLFNLLKDLNIRPWTLRPGCGVVSSFQTKSTNSGQLYICLISPQKRPNSSSSPIKDANKSKYLLCCLSLREKGLESFREDLDTFTGTLKPYLIKQNPDFTPDSELYQHIQSWTSTLYYLSRLIPKCHDQLPLLLHASLNSTVKVSGDNPETIQELKRFVDCCRVDVLMEKQQQNPIINQQLIDLGSENDSSVVDINVTGDSITVSLLEANEFFHKWSKDLLSRGKDNIDSFYLRKVIEVYKLKIIQDMNAFKRLVRDAEINYYCLYKCYTFLQSTGNADLLLKCSLREAQSQDEKESKAVLDSLDEFMHRKNETVTKKTAATATGSSIDLI